MALEHTLGSYESHEADVNSAELAETQKGVIDESLEGLELVQKFPVTDEEINTMNDHIAESYEGDLASIVRALNVNVSPGDISLESRLDALSKAIIDDDSYLVDAPEYNAWEVKHNEKIEKSNAKIEKYKESTSLSGKATRRLEEGTKPEAMSEELQEKKKLAFSKKRKKLILKQALQKNETIQKAYKDYIFHPFLQHIKAYEGLRKKLVKNLAQKGTGSYVGDVYELFDDGVDQDILEQWMSMNPIIDYKARKDAATRAFYGGKRLEDENFETLTLLQAENDTYGATTFDQLHTLFKTYLTDAVLFGDDAVDVFANRKTQFDGISVGGLSTINYSMGNPLTGSSSRAAIEVDDFIDTF